MPDDRGRDQRVLGLYILTLAASAGLVGVYFRQMLAGLGMIAHFDAGILLAGGVASIYAAIQLAYMIFLRLLFPTSARGVYGAEILSHGSAVLLIPYLIELDVPWPHPVMERAQVLIYLGVFLTAHLFLKLASFYASLQGYPSGRWGLVGWSAAFVGAVWAAFAGLTNWVDVTERSRPGAPADQAYFRVGGAYAEARVLPEGSRLEWELEPVDGQTLTLRWAAFPESDAGASDVDVVYATVELIGDQRKAYYAAAKLDNHGWVEMRVPTDAFPSNVRLARIHWARTEIPSWQRVLGLEPIVYGGVPESPAEESAPAPRVLLAGPYQHRQRPEAEGLNVLLITVGGLSQGHTTMGRYERNTTPALARLAASSSTFMNAFTPAPDGAAALASLVTGLHPWQHSVWSSAGEVWLDAGATLPEVLRDQGYTTVAFTEGEAGDTDDLIVGSGFERGFELFDPSYGAPIVIGQEDEATVMEGSAVTLRKAQAWIANHEEVKFFAMIRLRELMEPGPAERYGEPYAPIDRARPVDLYDAIVSYLDRHIGALIQYVRDHETRRNTCIIVTGTHGVDFSGAGASFDLTEPALRVPLIIFLPGQDRAPRTDLVSLEDVTATLAALAGTRLPGNIAGREFLVSLTPRRPVSMTRTPLGFSLRTEDFRYTWYPEGNGGTAPPGLFRVSNRAGWWRNDVSAQNAERVTRYREELQSFMDRYSN